MSRSTRVVAAALAALIVLLTHPPRAGATPHGGYRSPVDAPVTVPFQAPATPYGPGHRGLEYGTAAGVEVRAIGAGVVVFAGAVAGRRWVTVRHPDGLRSTTGPLATVAVAPGQRIEGAEALGTTAGRLLLTVRRGTSYLDPATILDHGPPRVHLVPDRTPWPRRGPAH